MFRFYRRRDEEARAGVLICHEDTRVWGLLVNELDSCCLFFLKFQFETCFTV